MYKISFSTILVLLCLQLTDCKPAAQNDTAQTELAKEVLNPLPSWDSTAASRILQWVEAATDSSRKDFIPMKDRIAVFDNDGTLWPEQPYPNQMQFAFDYLRQHAPQHPEWKKDPLIGAVVKGDLAPLQKAGLKGAARIVGLSHTGMSTDEFQSAVSRWMDTATDKKFNTPFRELVYQPMLELLQYLRINQFKTFIVSGGGADFMRPWTEAVYGIPPYQVIGSYGELVYEVKDGKPMIHKVKGDIYVDDKVGKPVAIHRFIGKVPVFCGGNSDGDLAMMQYTHSSPYKSFCLIVHHTDGDREFAYDTRTLSGHLETALQEASQKNWMVVDMKSDWKKVFPFQ